MKQEHFMFSLNMCKHFADAAGTNGGGRLWQSWRAPVSGKQNHFAVQRIFLCVELVCFPVHDKVHGKNVQWIQEHSPRLSEQANIGEILPF